MHTVDWPIVLTKILTNMISPYIFVIDSSINKVKWKGGVIYSSGKPRSGL